MSEAIPNAEYIRALLDGKEVEYESREHWRADPTWERATISVLVNLQGLKCRIKPELGPLTVYVSRNYAGGNIQFYSEKFENEYWGFVGEFILQPKEQTP